MTVSMSHHTWSKRWAWCRWVWAITPGPRDEHDAGQNEPSHLVQEMSMMTVSMSCIIPGPRDEHDDGEYEPSYLVQEMSMMTVSMSMLERMPAVVDSQGWWYMMCRRPENSAWTSSCVLYTCSQSNEIKYLNSEEVMSMLCHTWRLEHQLNKHRHWCQLYHKNPTISDH